MCSLLSIALALAAAAPQGANQDSAAGLPLYRKPKTDIAWNRLYDYPEIHKLFDRLWSAHPELVDMEVIGKSVEGRDMRVYVLNNPATGDHRTKPAMWIDANVHGNEVQGAEVTLYLAWYLLENHGKNDRVTELLDRVAFYIQPMVNPDGRAHWFNDAHNAHSSRTGYRPTDNDRDGAFDEDPADDLDGDGHIVQMRKYVPGEGTHRLNADDPRLLEPVRDNDRGIKGDWVLLGSEGIDNDGDGRINEDGLGGYDMNRAWPALWKPSYVQRGAGEYPLYWPETRCIAEFLLDHPNIAAVQSFHNAGGMILRGPGAEVFGKYPRRDVRVYDELGKDGERMLPFYRYMIIWKDLYSVFGGFVTWAYEGLGIISFTNELWTPRRNFPQEKEKGFRERRGDGYYFDDNLTSGDAYVDWHPFDHPLYGAIEIGGFKKDVGRVPPSFLIEEGLHRNAMFCIKHAEAMPLVTVAKLEATELGDGIYAVDALFENKRAIPTRTGRAADVKAGRPDVFTIAGRDIEVLAGGFRSDRWRPERIELAEREPQRLLREDGIGGRSLVRVRWFVRGSGELTVTFEGDQAVSTSAVLELR